MHTEFTHDGHQYRVEHLPAMSQFHVVRRLGPVLAQALASRAFTIAAAEALAKLPDADVEYVVGMCLSTMQRQDVKVAAWAPVQVSGRMMFADIDTLPAMMALITHSMKAQFSDFFSAAVLPESGGAAQATGQISRGMKTG